MVAYVFYWCPCLMFGPRFYYEALPPLLLLSARGVFELARLPTRVWRRLPTDHSAAAGTVFPAILLGALLAYNLTFYFPIQIPLYQDYNYSSDAELRAVAHARIQHALVFVVTQPNYAWWAYGDVFFANDPLLRGDVIYARDNGTLDPLLYPYFPGRAHYRLNGTTITAIR